MLKRPFILAVLTFTVGLTRSAQAQSPTILQDYLYGYAPVAVEATRAFLTAVPDTTQPGRAPINQFAYTKTLSTPSEQLVIRPNADTLYSGAWLDLTAQPIILHVPDVGSRYYVMPLLDAYSNEFSSIGSRTTGTKKGNYAIVGPLWQGATPANVDGVIVAPTNTVWLMGRTLVYGAADLPNAAAITSQYQLIPLSAYPAFLQTGKYQPPAKVPVTLPNLDFVATPVTNSVGFSKPEFFDVLAAYALQNPAPAAQRTQTEAFVLNGLINQDELNSTVASQADTAIANELVSATTLNNGWSFIANVGSYGTNYLLRAAIASYGLGAASSQDAIYLNASTDNGGSPLNGSKSYKVHFAPGQTPPQQGFWSVTVYNQSGFLVSNSLDRYSLGSVSGLVANSDGSIDILLQNTKPATLQSNWLPVPTAQFNLTLRIYWPDSSVLNGSWIAPTVSAQ